MSGWRRTAIMARACLISAFAIGMVASAALVTGASAQQPDGQGDNQQSPGAPENQPPAASNLMVAAGIYKSLQSELPKVSELPCIDQATLDRLLGEFAQLEGYANAQGDNFIKGGDPGDANTAVMATKWADELQPMITFIKTMQICGGPMPWDPPPGGGGGGVTDGPNGGWPEGIIPPSRTQIPECFNAAAQALLEMLKKKIPDEDIKMANLRAEMSRLRKEIIDLSSGQARAKAKGEQPDPNAQAKIEDDQAHYSGLAFQLRSIVIQQTLDKEDLAKLEWLKKNRPCPEEHGMYVPGSGSTKQYITYATDSTTHCTYTGGTFTTSLVTSFTDGPPSIVPAPSAPRPSNSQPSDKPQTAMVPDRPVRPVDKPTPPSTPPATETTPAAPEDTPSDIPDDVEIKAKQEVVEGGQTGGPLEGQVIKLVLTEKSDLPVPVDPKAPLARRSADTKFDRSPNQCTTDASGACKIKIAPEDRATYRLASPKKEQQRTYQLDIARPQTSGSVAEITPGNEKVDPKMLQSLGSKIVASTFKIGNRNYIRFATEVKYRVDTPIASKLKEAYGSSHEEDICREKYPDRLLVEQVPGKADVATSELPGANVRLSGRPSKRRVSR